MLSCLAVCIYNARRGIVHYFHELFDLVVFRILPSAHRDVVLHAESFGFAFFVIGWVVAKIDDRVNAKVFQCLVITRLRLSTAVISFVHLAEILILMFGKLQVRVMSVRRLKSRN